MSFIKTFLDFFLHLDDHVAEFVAQYGNMTYLILFSIVFVETGLVIMPFLPGDSLLFAAGATCAITDLKFGILWAGFILAAFLGDNLNYWVGRRLGNYVYDLDSRWIKREYIDQTNAYYDKYGVLTVILARFMPFVRTFAPFVAGVGKMPYLKFISYSVVGAILWVSLFLAVGYKFGSYPIVKDNFAFVSLGIVGISVLPILYKIIGAKWASYKAKKEL